MSWMALGCYSKNFLAGESVDQLVVERLRIDGRNALGVTEMVPSTP